LRLPGPLPLGFLPRSFLGQSSRLLLFLALLLRFFSRSFLGQSPRLLLFLALLLGFFSRFLLLSLLRPRLGRCRAAPSCGALASFNVLRRHPFAPRLEPADLVLERLFLDAPSQPDFERFF